MCIFKRLGRRYETTMHAKKASTRNVASGEITQISSRYFCGPKLDSLGKSALKLDGLFVF